MVDFARRGRVEQPGISPHLPQDRPVLGDLSADLFRDQSSQMAVGEHGSDDRKAGIDPFVEHPHCLVQVDQRPQFKSTRLHDYAGISSSREATDRKNTQRRWAVENDRCVLVESGVLQAGLKDVFPACFGDELSLTPREVNAARRDTEPIGQCHHRQWATATHTVANQKAARLLLLAA